MKKIVIVFFCFMSLSQAENIRADVEGVYTKGTTGSYTFSVKLKSIETGCAQYADWWEVLSEKGELLYRRILVHSHPDTQPFTRSGGPVNIDEKSLVYVRAHMNTVGYVGDVYVGSVKEGFKKSDMVPSFPKALERTQPLPKGCLY